MKPIVFDLPNEQYHRSSDTASYISSSQLKDYAVSPAYAKYMREHPELREETPAMKLGTMFHDLMEEIINGKTIDEALSKYAVYYPPYNARTGQPYGESTQKWQEGYQQFLLESDGKTIISEKNLATITGMAKSLLSIEENQKMIQYATPQEGYLKGSEISFFTELAPGVYGKCRCDGMTSKKIFDFKSTSSQLDPESIASTILKFKYDTSAAFYQYIVWKVTGQFYPFYWIFTTTSEPYSSSVPVSAEHFAFSSEDDIIAYENDVDRLLMFNHGVMEMRALLDEHILCVSRNEWPGAEVFVEPTDAGVHVMCPVCPQWAMNKIIKFYN